MFDAFEQSTRVAVSGILAITAAAFAALFLGSASQ
jgi:hypothetical protein